MEALRARAARSLDGTSAALALAILSLNTVDAFATIRHLHHGAEELNPLMDWLLRRGAGWFLIVKHALASLGVIGIAMHTEVRAARVALWMLLPIYVAIAIYQLALFAVIQ